MKKVLLLGLLLSSVSHAASFDCNKAANKVEKLICSTPSLSQADDQLYIVYQQAKATTSNDDNFKRFVKDNWQERQRCTTVSCLSNWYQRLSGLYKHIADNKNDKGCYEEGQEVTMPGTLARQTFPGPPNYESVEQGDEPETYWIFSPDEKSDRCVRSSRDDSDGYDDMGDMQLIVKDEVYKNQKNLIGKSVVVTGSLMHSVSGHHNTTWLLIVSKLAAK